MPLFEEAAALIASISVLGILYLIVAIFALARFVRRPVNHAAKQSPITVLKPLCGVDAGLEDNLRSFCRQTYAEFQIVFGVRDPADPAIAIVERLRDEFPACDIALVVNSRLYGSNYKVSNLINMMSVAKHALLIIADSDMVVPHSYLAQVAAPLADPRVGISTCLYRGRPSSNLWSRLAALFINVGFLPSVLVGQMLKAQEGCFGGTIVFRRDFLVTIGGFYALRDKLADDYALGAAVRAAGYKIALSPMIVETRVDETSFSSLFRHELRWGRTVRSIAPLGFAGSVLTYPFVLAALALILAVIADGNIILFTGWAGLVLLLRWGHLRAVERLLKIPSEPLILALARDFISVAVIIRSFCGSRVEWRGQRFYLDATGDLMETEEFRHDEKFVSSPPVI